MPGGAGGDTTGSPPRARGGLHRHRDRHEQHRITPACVGRTKYPAITKGATDHPRVRGEDAGVKGDQLDNDGSPPRARGGLLVGHRNVLAPRITPACAGSMGPATMVILRASALIIWVPAVLVMRG